MIPFKEQFDKLTRAYIEGKVNPYSHCACFVGNLLNESEVWRDIRTGCRSLSHLLSPINDFEARWSARAIKTISQGTYTYRQIATLEVLFITTFEEHCGRSVSERFIPKWNEYENSEEALFIAFEKTLELLKAMHEMMGEKVDDFEFKRREVKRAEGITLV